MWRDGQKKRVFVYRFLATGTIEEKVLAACCCSRSCTAVDFVRLASKPLVLLLLMLNICMHSAALTRCHISG